ncbi:MAG TPA: hypothetical protein VMT85_12465 [Thermoanaerobaculia bacterium]|nr:hypothetical protein [Thermoanaerobaculia bacterium]
MIGSSLPRSLFAALLLLPSSSPGQAAPARPEPARAAAVRAIDLEIELDPGTGGVRGTARIDVESGSGASAPLSLELLDALVVDSVTRGGADLRWEAAPPPAGGSGDRGTDESPHGGGQPPRAAKRLRVWLEPVEDVEPSSESPAIEIRYHGTLRQDWASGERAGEIHNFAVDAHVGRDGIYLSSGVPWYPRPAVLEDAGEADGEGPAPLIDHEVALRGVPGMLLVASGNRVSAEEQVVGADEVWRTPFPISGVAVAGGPRRAHTRRVGQVVVVAHLTEPSSQFADALLDAAAGYLELYQPLIGAYPYRELTIVENFFSSGFAYPGFTLLASAVIQMGESSLRPGYLDHEMLHAWWGNGVLGAPRQGVWSEGLTSYCANLMRDVLEGRDDIARAQRRSILERLSQLDPKADRPLATFGTEDGASRFIGYQKGSVVFAELARHVGSDRLWYALRNLAATRMGELTGWADIQRSFERSTGRDLDAFFDFWVDGSGIPDLSPRAAVWTAGEGTAGELRLELGEPTPVAVPGLELRLLGSDEPVVATVDVPAGVTTIEVPLARRPETVEVDPEHQTVRRLPPEIWMPSISGISASKPLRILRARGEEAAIDERYGVVVEALRERFEKRGELSEERVPVSRRTRRGEGGDVGEPGHLLVLGRAAAAPAAAELRAAAGLELDDAGSRFVLDGEEHAAPTDAVLACVRRPGEAGAVACIVWGNSAEALARAHLLTFYGGDSLLRFEDGRPVERRRFEGAERIPVAGDR